MTAMSEKSAAVIAGVPARGGIRALPVPVWEIQFHGRSPPQQLVVSSPQVAGEPSVAIGTRIKTGQYEDYLRLSLEKLLADEKNPVGWTLPARYCPVGQPPQSGKLNLIQ